MKEEMFQIGRSIVVERFMQSFLTTTTKKQIIVSFQEWGFYMRFLYQHFLISDIENDIWTKWPRFSKIIISPKLRYVLGHHMV